MQVTSAQYDQMITILEDIESLNLVPDKLEQQISQKLFLSAFKTLSIATVKANQEDIAQIPALQAMKSYLQSQEVNLYSVLVEELHNHIYLKSPYTDSRWHSYRQGVDDFGTVEQVLENKIRFELSEKTTSETSQLDEFLKKLKKDDFFVEINSETAESDSFYYIRLLIETLGNLNRLPNAFEEIIQRMPSELHKMIDKTIVEVGQRFPKNLNIQTSKSPFALYEVGLHAGDNRMAALKDLTWTLYSKYIAILQAHRVIYEVTLKISDAQGKSGTYDFGGIYQAIENDIKTFLNSYIQTSKSEVVKNTLVDAVVLSEKTRYSFDKINRKKNHSLFKFSKMDILQDGVKDEYQQLQVAYEKSVPGLVASARESAHDDEDGLNPYLPADLKVAHQLLVSPNVFNIRVMLEPTVQFIQKADAIFPGEIAKPQMSFVENFMMSSFVPQLEYALIEVYNKVIASIYDGTSSILTETSINWPRISKLPVLDDVVRFYDYLRRTCYLLNTSAVYREHYVRLVLRVVERFGKACVSSFDSKVTFQARSANDDSKLVVKRKLGASWVGDPTLRKVISNTDYHDASTVVIMATPTNVVTSTVNGQKLSPYQQEVNFYLNKRASQKLRHVTGVLRSDLLSYASFQGIATLATSLRWLVLKMKQLMRVIDKGAEDVTVSASGEMAGAEGFSASLRKKWLLIELIRPVEDVSVLPVGNSTSLYGGPNSSALSLASSLSNENNDSESSTSQEVKLGGIFGGNMESVALTLSGTTVDLFEKAVDQLERLAETCVLTLKADVRCRALYYMDATVKRGTFYVGQSSKVGTQDASEVLVGQLDTDLTKLDGIMEETLVPLDRRTVLGGLSKFMDLLVVGCADGIDYINEGGISKMGRHLVVLQQMLKGLEDSPADVDFSQSKAFFKYAELTPAAVLDQVKRRTDLAVAFGYDQIKTLLRLIRSKNMRRFQLTGNREAELAEKAAYNEDLVKLHEYYWGSEKVNV